MTTNEAAAYLRKSTNAIRTAVCRGHIKARKFRRRLYFKRSELDRLIETSTTIGG
jgi:excisionase family DNA binding protein